MAQLKQIRTDYFYIEKASIIEIYGEFNGMLFRYIYQKVNDETDALFKERYLLHSTPVKNISYFHEQQYQQMLLQLNESLESLHTRLLRIEELMRSANK